MSRWARGCCQLVLLTLLGLSCAPLSAAPLARNVQFSNLTSHDGLSSEFVHAVVQDAEGFIWFGTQDGLNRFDGHEIVVYEHDPLDARSLKGNFVRALYADSAGRLWVATNSGMSLYDPVTDTFDNDALPLSGEDQSLAIRAVIEDHLGTFWLGTIGTGLISVHPASGRVKRFVHDAADPASLPSDAIIAIHEDSKGRLWVGTDGGGLARFERASDSFIVYRHAPDNPRSLSDDTIRALYEDRTGSLWVGTAGGGLSLMLDSIGNFRRFENDPDDPLSLGAGQVTAVLEDLKGTLWVGSEAGLYEWRPDVQGFVRYQRDTADLSSLAGDRINAMYQDRSGVLWLATHGGVSSWNYFSDPFTYYQTAQGILENDVVTSIAETENGTLWVGTYGGGLSHVDLMSGESLHFRADPERPDSLTDDRVMVVHVDPLDRVWVGTRNGGLNLLNEDGVTFTSFRHDSANSDSLSGDAITSILTEPDGSLWVGVFDGGLNRTSSDAPGIFQRFRHVAEDPSSLSSDRVLAVHRDTLGELWIGTEGGGLNRYDPAAEAFTRFPITEVQDDASSGTPWAIAEARNGDFWLATMGDGLLRWSREDRQRGLNRFQRFGKTDGLAATIYGLIEGVAGDLWLSSNRGLFRFDPESGEVRQFDARNGLRGTEFNHNAQLRSRSGRLLFGGINGIVSFFPGELPRNQNVPQIAVRAQSRNEILARGSSVRESGGITLGYLDPFVAFDFVALDMVSPDKNQYRYRLWDFDADWIAADTFRHATYSNLPAGNFRFEVQASNNDGVWNEEGVSVEVTVIPPPWQTWWAYLSYALVALALVAWYGQAQRRKVRQAEETRRELERQVSERTSELASRNTELQQLNEELQVVNEKLAEASVTDSLTGLRNRRFVDQFINTEVSMVERRHTEVESPVDPDDVRDSSQMLFFMMIDLDGFKAINDSYGHHAGDEVLIQVKEVLVDCCRSSDVVIRWGGDEFMIIGHASSFPGAKVLAERIRDSLAKRPFHIGNGNIGRISASIGVAPYPFCTDEVSLVSWELVAGVADQAAYLAKQNGRNAWVSICGADGMSVDEVVSTTHDLQGLVERGRVLVDSSIEGGLDLSDDAKAQLVANR